MNSKSELNIADFVKAKQLSDPIGKFKVETLRFFPAYSLAGLDRKQTFLKSIKDALKGFLRA